MGNMGNMGNYSVKTAACCYKRPPVTGTGEDYWAESGEMMFNVGLSN